MIGIVDYGMGNLRSVQKALEYVGCPAFISGDATRLARADKLVLPGVGAFRDAIATLRETGLDELIVRAVQAGTPTLGICLGMQLLFDVSYENGEYQGLGLLPGRIVRLPDTVKVPHIGWNSLRILQREPLFAGLPEEPYVYFVHSYYLKTEAPVVSAVCDYGTVVQAAAQRDNLFAVQFHPEKSGDVGLRILKNFGGL